MANTLGAFIGVDVATRLDLPSAWIIHESYELPVWWQMMAGEIDARRLYPEPMLRGVAGHRRGDLPGRCNACVVRALHRSGADVHGAVRG